MDTSSFINALHRFFAIRGAVKLFRSDCGNNFVSACKELQINKPAATITQLRSFSKILAVSGSLTLRTHLMAGSWKWMMEFTRRILDTMLLEHRNAKVTRETLVMSMAEVTAIVNARPLTTVSKDPDNPAILTPAMLLTQKVAVPPGQLDESDLFKAQWKHVQHPWTMSCGADGKRNTALPQMDSSETKPCYRRCGSA